jgi:phosphatidylinositol alpha-1,6-mannosyltransferase
MKTLLLAPELFQTDSGIPRCLRLYLKALCERAGPRDDQVSFVALNDTAADSTDLRLYGGPGLFGWSVCSRDKVRFVREAHRLSAGCELIICGHVAQLPVAWLMSWLRPRLRYILIAHGIEVWRPFTFWQRRALRGAARIFCVSDFTRRELLRQLALDERRLVVLPNALDPQLAAASAAPEIPATPPVILTVARLSHDDSYKGIDHLIEAMPAIRRAMPTVKLRIVGRGNDQMRLQKLARKLELGSAVEFAGFVSDLELREEFARCRLFALPSQKEGFGLVYLEAMTHGRPCLGARAGGTPEVIDADSGVLVEYGDVPGLAAAAVAALQRPWNEAAIRAHADYFSYSQFQTRLASLLPT